jgi:hypothetical protein
MPDPGLERVRQQAVIETGGEDAFVDIDTELGREPHEDTTEMLHVRHA